MPVTVTHALSMTTPDNPAYENQPKHWNSSHFASLNAVGSEISGAFNNAGGVTFGLETNGSITAAAPGGAPSPVNFSAGTTSNNLGSVVFTNANGVSFGLNGSTISASIATTYAGTGFTSTTTAGTAIVGTNNTAGLSLGVPAFLTTAMASNRGTDFVQANAVFAGTNASGTIASNGISVSVGNYITTARGSTDAIGLNTAQSNVTWTVNSSGLSLDARGYAGTGTTFNGANISGSMTVNSNGVQLSLSGGAAGGGATISQYYRPIANLATVGAPVQNSASIIDCLIQGNYSFSRFDLIASVSVATTTNNSSAGILYSITAALYSLNAGTLSSIFSGTTNNQATFTSNATASVTGALYLSCPLAGSVGPGNYWIGAQISTRATGLTGAATTSLGNTFSMLGVLTNNLIAISAHEPGAQTASSGAWYQGLGMYSGTSNFSTIGMSNITAVGTGANRANLALRMINQ